jgi:hypothetical protein
MDPSELRRCGRCRELKPVDQFAWRRIERGQRDNMCRPCRSAYGKEHYLANRQRYIDAEARRKQARAEERMVYLIDFFRSHPCVDCGESDPMVLEFDHVGVKKFNVAKGLRDRPWQSALDEIEQCEVVCANCHRRRTASRGGFIRALLVADGAQPGCTYNRPRAGEV